MGQAARRSFGSDQNVIAFNLYVIRRHGPISWQGSNSARLDIEASSVSRADDHIAVQRPFHQRTRVVGATVFDREDLAANVEQTHRCALVVHQHLMTGGQIICLRHLDKLSHRHLTARASFYVYNQPSEVDRLAEVLEMARQLLGD